jgi:hypothetical protein
VSDEQQRSIPPQPGEDAKVVRESEERPVVRDSKDNPVVRSRDLELALKPLYRLLYLSIGAGLINFASRFTPAAPPETAVVVFHFLTQLL